MERSVIRTQRLRRQILQIVENAKVGGSISGRWISDFLDQEEIDGDNDVIGLAQDLINLGLLHPEDRRTTKNQKHVTLDLMRYSITAKGTGLLLGLEPICPLVYDERR